MVESKAEGSEGDRRRRAEEAGEALGTEDVTEDREEADDDATDQRAKKQVGHVVRCRVTLGRCMDLRGLFGLLDEPESSGGLFAAEKLILLAFETVVIDAKIFQLLDEVFGQVISFLTLAYK